MQTVVSCLNGEESRTWDWKDTNGVTVVYSKDNETASDDFKLHITPVYSLRTRFVVLCVILYTWSSEKITDIFSPCVRLKMR